MAAVRCQAAATAERPLEQEAESLTRRMFRISEEQEHSNQQASGAGGGTTYAALQKADEAWLKMRTMKTGAAAGPAPQTVRESSQRLGTKLDYDVVMCGGTLGVFLACLLQLNGFRVAIVERGPLKGRSQEWNISRAEVNELVDQGLVTQQEADECITSEFNPVRAGFHKGTEVWVRDILNIGVRPEILIAKVRQRFVDNGGQLYEMAAATEVTVHPDGVDLGLTGPPPGKGPQPPQPLPPHVTCRLVLDCMGNASPIVRQARWGTKPDGVCLVVGACCRGFDKEKNTAGDLIYTTTDAQLGDARVPWSQYFWEAFPAGSGPADRTTYMFSYMDADSRRPTLEAMLEDYWHLMPEYQQVKLDDLIPQRILFGMFPTYRKSPLPPSFDRILQIGDASGVQSPLSFGGFGALMRYLPRLKAALLEALEVDALDREALAAINGYNPGLSGAWMLQRAMSIQVGQNTDPSFINQLLSKNFAAMKRQGPATLRPFLQDVVQFGGLASTLSGQVLADPFFTPKIFGHVGIGPLLDWTRHFVSLGTYTALHKYATSSTPPSQQSGLTPRQRYFKNRQREAWKYGSGLDYKH
ncbi:hypothetical protein WJX74_003932 [Apatococcus lobatus]|uniref:Uncharacterized protein n=1 Tax=Apatococcus lobatus TaxID=904363 RepID=A0AAW1QHK9_9CHLO